MLEGPRQARKVSATIDGDMTGVLAAPSDLACPYVIFIETLWLGQALNPKP